MFYPKIFFLMTNNPKSPKGRDKGKNKPVCRRTGIKTRP
jgi:hypothetical protein